MLKGSGRCLQLQVVGRGADVEEDNSSSCLNSQVRDDAWRYLLFCRDYLFWNLSAGISTIDFVGTTSPYVDAPFFIKYFSQWGIFCEEDDEKKTGQKPRTWTNKCEAMHLAILITDVAKIKTSVI
jgi:hypothetical protein